MTKAILLSIRPEHALNILEGRKTLELRKSIPKDFLGWVYVYVTKAKPYLVRMFGRYTLSDRKIKDLGDFTLSGRIVARFWFDEYEEILNHGNKFTIKDKGEGYTNLMAKKSCLDFVDLVNYFKDKNGYAWHIKKLEIFDKPMELSEFELRNKPAIWYDETSEKWDTVKRAPKSWQYVWVNSL